MHGFSKKAFHETSTVTMTKSGEAMGSPLEHTFANIFSCAYEILGLGKCPPEFKPVICKRYVGDTFLLFQKKPYQSNWKIQILP